MMELDYGYSPRFGRSDFSNYGYAGGLDGYGAQPRHEPGTIISLTMKPSVNSNTTMYMLEAFTVRVQLNLQPPVSNDEQITAELVRLDLLSYYIFITYHIITEHTLFNLKLP